MSERPPNIILIITDQQRYDTIRALGFPYMDTPHLDRLADEGVVLANCFCAAPSCAPARASLFTGQYPHTTGVFKNKDQWRRSWVEDVAASGYYCVNVGKMHTYPFETDLGFHERYVVENKDRYYEGRYYFDEWDKALHARKLDKPGRELYRQLPDYRERMGAVDWPLPKDMHPDMFVGDLATWWLKRHPVKEPLFLVVGFPGPHPPYDPVSTYTERYLERDLPIAPATPEDLAGQPAPFHALRQHNAEVDHDSVVHDLAPSREQLHRLRAHYLANVTMIDEKIGEILGTLDERGYLDNAVVVFTSDHGDALGDHGHIQKWTMYDVITRVPTIVWDPRRFPGGRTLTGLVQQMDLGATILDLVGAPTPDAMEARSLMPSLTGGEDQGRAYVFAEHSRDPILQEAEFMTMVRSRTHKLVHFLDQPYGQLFDLENDPEEVDNLWDDARHADMKTQLLGVLREWLVRSNLQTGDWSREWR